MLGTRRGEKGEDAGFDPNKGKLPHLMFHAIPKGTIAILLPNLYLLYLT